MSFPEPQIAQNALRQEKFLGWGSTIADESSVVAILRAIPNVFMRRLGSANFVRISQKFVETFIHPNRVVKGLKKIGRFYRSFFCLLRRFCLLWKQYLLDQPNGLFYKILRKLYSLSFNLPRRAWADLSEMLDPKTQCTKYNVFNPIFDLVKFKVAVEFTRNPSSLTGALKEIKYFQLLWSKLSATSKQSKTVWRKKPGLGFQEQAHLRLPKRKGLVFVRNVINKPKVLVEPPKVIEPVILKGIVYTCPEWKSRTCEHSFQDPRCNHRNHVIDDLSDGCFLWKWTLRVGFRCYKVALGQSSQADHTRYEYLLEEGEDPQSEYPLLARFDDLVTPSPAHGRKGCTTTTPEFYRKSFREF